MKASDLRIGNYVYYEHTTHIVSGIHGNKVYSWWVKDGEPVIEYEAKDVSGTQVENPYMDVVSQYEPIPLTEEWLLKFGFVKEPLAYSINIDKFGKGKKITISSDYLYIVDSEKQNTIPTDIITIWNKDIIKEFYVHQLQNLYFALTGEELTLK